ncbi:unnamed protein product [Candida verbasci]|uniref:Uncharacterized protein n=1 Tax=Candida verbasci TaxID=1227364 RepID=A0A9W4X833_9ASCO|nr:unnamed protein product [Candida verbasci]
MSDIPSDEELDNPIRIILVIDNKFNENGEDMKNIDDAKDEKEENSKKENEMEEILLDNIQSFKLMNEFFDQFDESIAIPNEGKIKYEVGSDGLVIIIVESKDLFDKTQKFIEDYDNELSKKLENTNEEEDNTSKKTKV